MNTPDVNTDTLKGRWNELKGKAKARWAKLTDDDLQQVEGKADELAGKLQKHYGMTKDKARQEIDSFCESC